MSVFEALRAAAWWNNVNVEITWVNAEDLEHQSEKQVAATFKPYDGILVPGGFGSRGLEGKIRAAQYALKDKVPYLGLCLGLQMAVIAAARNGGLKAATTFELDPKSKHEVINTMADQKGLEMTGGTMRLGNYDCHLEPGSLAAKVYGASDVVERHRHRGECNNDYRDQYEKWGIKATGINQANNLVEVIEGVNHPFLLASQFHPELKSRPTRPHPMFNGFIKALL
jgi:CTP synthase